MKPALFVLILAACSSVASADSRTYDAGRDFSWTQNPNGVWTYGWSATLGGPLHQYKDLIRVMGQFLWEDNSITVANDPNLGYNARTTPFQYFPPRCMLMHPGPQNQISNCVWTAPAAGIYTIQSTFVAIWTGGPHGYLLENGVKISDSLLTQNRPWSVALNAVTLAAGDKIDAALGVGSDGVYFNDNTYFSLRITKLDSPGATAAGYFKAVIVGASGAGLPAGALSATVYKGGSFTAVLDWGGERIPLEGSFAAAGGNDTRIVKLKNGTSIVLSLGFDGAGKLTGSVLTSGELFSVEDGSERQPR
jgi:hypothetical protein